MVLRLTRALAYLRISILGDSDLRSKILERLRVKAEDIFSLETKAWITGIGDINLKLIILNPDLHPKERIVSALYYIEADLLIICITKEWLDIFVKEVIPILKNCKEKGVIIIVDNIESERQIEIFDKLINLGIHEVIIKDINAIDNSNELISTLLSVIKKVDIVRKLEERQKKFLAKSIKELDNEVLLDAYKGEESKIRDELEGLM